MMYEETVCLVELQIDEVGVGVGVVALSVNVAFASVGQ